MLLLLLLLCFQFVTLVHSTTCPQGTISLPQNDNVCMTVQQTGDKNGYFGAEAVCAKQTGGHLISINNAFANEMIASYATLFLGGATTGSVFIGGDNQRNGTFSWIDKKSMNYTNWASGEPSRNDSCIAMRLSDRKWFATDCSTSLPYLCETPMPACPEHWTAYNNNCYNLFREDNSVVWVEARRNCTNMGAELTSIHSDSENSFLLGLLNVPRESAYNPWIGLYYDGELHWTDGSNVTYSNVVNQVPSYKSAVYDLAFLWPNVGQWWDYDSFYGTSAYTYICKQPFYGASASSDEENQETSSKSMKRNSAKI